jgi:hypothetical protein
MNGLNGKKLDKKLVEFHSGTGPVLYFAEVFVRFSRLRSIEKMNEYFKIGRPTLAQDIKVETLFVAAVFHPIWVDRVAHRLPGKPFHELSRIPRDRAGGTLPI